MPSIDEVRAQIAKIDGVSKLVSGRSIDELPKVLWEDEIIEDAVSGSMSKKNGLALSTNKRLIFIRKGLIGGSVEDIPYDKMSSIQYDTGLIMGSIAVFTSGNKIEIENIPKPFVRPFAERLRARVTAAKEGAQITPAAATQTPSADPVEQIQRLAALRDQGILSEEEFAAKKRQLLGLD